MSAAHVLIVLAEVVREAAVTTAGLWLLAAMTWIGLGYLHRRVSAFRRLQAPRSDSRFLRHELLFSALNILGTSVAGLGTAWLLSAGHISVDGDWGGWPTGLAQFVVYFIAFDFYFYWLHRLLHTDAAYRWIHRRHHASKVPGPLTAFSFHPIEGIASNAFVTLMMFIMDLNIVALVVIYGYGVISSLLVHGGYEMFPRGWYRSVWTRWYLTPSFHDLHHERQDGNFGGFTTIWDRVFGTVSPAFEVGPRLEAQTRKGPGVI